MSSEHRGPFVPPKSISPQAQAALAKQWPSHHVLPPLEDKEAWHRHIAERDALIAKVFYANQDNRGFAATWDRVANVPVVRARPPERDHAGKVLLDIHGGALIYLGGENVKHIAVDKARDTRCDVVSIDYRMPPDHPYPAALDDCLMVYASLAREVGAGNIIVGGASAGANLAAATLLRARDDGLPMPAGLVLLSPECDLTESGDTFQTLLGADRMGTHMAINQLYAGAFPLEQPYISPLFGDLSGFPPTFLQSGTRDLFLSNTVRMHRGLRKAGVEADLHVWEAMPHGGFLGAPEDEEINVELRAFVARVWGS